MLATVQIPAIVVLPISMFSELNFRGGGSAVAALRLPGVGSTFFFGFLLFLLSLDFQAAALDFFAPLPLQVPSAMALA